MSFRSILAALRPASPAPHPRLAGRRAGFRPQLEPLDDRCLPSANVVLEWNQLALHAVGQARVSPVVGSRDLAITQVAVYDAVAAIDQSFEPYHAHVHASRGASLEAAAAQAAHDTLSALFPSQASTFDAALVADLVGIPPGRARQSTEVGHEVAQQILDWRSTDGSSAPATYTPGTDPGDWQPTPPANLPALAPQWRYVTPFAMTSGAQFRPAPPPALDSAAYAVAFNEVKSLGSATSTTRTAEQTQIAKFWNDSLGTAFAFGYWNRIAQTVATEQGLNLVQDARVFALLDIAEADALISTWDAKYEYNLWRPVTAIRAADTDGNSGTEADANWTPLLVTPNFPSYTSAHSTVSGAAASVLTVLFGTHEHFTVSADGLPGVTRSFDSFNAAAAEAGQSRIYGGIHYQFDNQNGLASGHALGAYVVRNFLLSTEREDERGGHGDPATGERADCRVEGPAWLHEDASNASGTNWRVPGERGGVSDSASVHGQPSLLPPPTVQTAAPVEEDKPRHRAEASDRLVARTVDREVSDQHFSGLDYSTFAEPLQGDKFFDRVR